MGQDLYHDGACTCATLANLTQKVDLPGRGNFHSQKRHFLYKSDFLKIDVVTISELRTSNDR